MTQKPDPEPESSSAPPRTSKAEPRAQRVEPAEPAQQRAEPAEPARAGTSLGASIETVVRARGTVEPPTSQAAPGASAQVATALGANAVVSAAGASFATATATATARVLTAEYVDLERRAAFLGQGDGAVPFVSFHSLFLAAFCAADQASRWAQSALAHAGLDLGRVLARWQASAPELAGVGAARLARCAELTADELQRLPAASTSASAQSVLDRAAALGARLDASAAAPALTPLLVLASYLFDPLSDHAADLAAWGLDAEAWASRLVSHAVGAEPTRAQAWLALYDRAFPRALSADLSTVLQRARRLAGAAPVGSRELLLGVVAAADEDADGGSTAAKLVSLLGPAADELRRRMTSPRSLDLTAAGQSNAQTPTPEAGAARPPWSPELYGVLARARVFATATAKTSATADAPAVGELATRHLVAALLTERRALPAFELLRQAGRTQRGLLAQLRRWLEAAPQGRDDPARWRRLFDEHRVELVAGYHNDETHGEDQLDISGDVNALAQVLASTKVSPPLSVGLFGDWGSGKSFFMRKLEARIDELYRAAKAQPDTESWFCGKQGKVVQIDFNAWHYMDADLWSSLAVRVFDALAEELHTTERDRFARACLLHLSSIEEREGKLDDEHRGLVERQLALEQALAKEQELRASREVELSTYAARLAAEAARKLATAPEVRMLTSQLGIPLGVLQGIAAQGQRDAEAVIAASDKWRSVFTSRRKTFAVLGVFAAVVVVGWGVAAAVKYRAQLQAAIIAAMGLVTTYGAGYAIVVGWIKRWTKPVNSAIDKVLELERVEREKKSKEELALEAERAQHAARVAELEREQLELTKQRAAVEAELARLRDGDARTLRQLILERASADDYRKNLGVISSIHRDFSELATLIDPRQRAERRKRQRERDAKRAAQDARRQKLDEQRAATAARAATTAGTEPGGAPGVGAPAAPGAAVGSQGAPSATTAPAPATSSGPEHRGASRATDDAELEVERIVLYIDDLDRCPPKRVIEVLQAIHIILSLPLFVVVVAVDSHWLTGSLEAYYNEQFPLVQGVEGRLRPQQYLEKIFQVPYTLLPMNDLGYRRLVSSLVHGAAAPAPRPREIGVPSADTPGGAPSAVMAAEPERTAGAQPVARGLELAPASAEPAPSARPASIDLTPLALELEPAELDYLTKLADLLPTPRTTKRLINLYRIVRASLTDEELTEFLGGEYQYIQLCLAVVLGNPLLASELLQQVFSAQELTAVRTWVTQRLTSAQKISQRDSIALTRFGAMLDESGLAQDPRRFRLMLRRVARFSFDTGRLLGRFPKDD